MVVDVGIASFGSDFLHETDPRSVLGISPSIELVQTFAFFSSHFHSLDGLFSVPDITYLLTIRTPKRRSRRCKVRMETTLRKLLIDSQLFIKMTILSELFLILLTLENEDILLGIWRVFLQVFGFRVYSRIKGAFL